MTTNTANRILEFLKENFPKVSTVEVDTFNFSKLKLTRDEAIIYTISSLDSEGVVVFNDSGDQIHVELENGEVIVTFCERDVDGSWHEFERGRIHL